MVLLLQGQLRGGVARVLIPLLLILHVVVVLLLLRVLLTGFFHPRSFVFPFCYILVYYSLINHSVFVDGPSRAFPTVPSSSPGFSPTSAMLGSEADVPLSLPLRVPLLFRPCLFSTVSVSGLPFVPMVHALANQRKRRRVVRHRRCVRQGLPVRVRWPLSDEFVSTLKAAMPGRSYYGPPHHTCIHCGASFWFQERCKWLSKRRRVIYSGCCRGGKVSLPVPRSWPSPLWELMRFDGGSAAKSFMRSIRQYNSMFAFTSLGVHVDKSVNVGDGPYIFKIRGTVHHKIGSLVPRDGSRPEFAQLYIYDTANELENRMAIFRHVAVEEGRVDGVDGAACFVCRAARSDVEPDRRIVAMLMRMLNECGNPLVCRFRTASDRLFSPEAPDISIRLFGQEGTGHDSRYSLPTVSELAALIVGDFTTDACRFDVVVQSKMGHLEEVSPLNPSLMSLQYPLLFPYGDRGFHVGIKYLQHPLLLSFFYFLRFPLFCAAEHFQLSICRAVVLKPEN